MILADLRAYQSVPVLVFGADGFIGRWVSRGLAQQGARLFQAAFNRASAQATLQKCQAVGEIIEIDITQHQAVDELLRRVRPVIVFNLAGYGVSQLERDAAQYYRVNAEFVEHICQTLVDITIPGWSGRALVHAGSALEYGTLNGDLAEDSPPNPTTIYGRTKLAGTHHIQRFGQQNGLKGVTARLFTVYGPGEHPERLLPSLMRAAGDGSVLPLTGGQQERDFTYVEQVAEGLLRLGLAEAQPGEVVNLATGRLTSVRSFVQTAAKLLQMDEAQLNFNALPTRPEEMQHAPVNVQRLLSLTGWLPTLEITEGIIRTIQFHPKV